jgi:hypothetical protein
MQKGVFNTIMKKAGQTTSKAGEKTYNEAQMRTYAQQDLAKRGLPVDEAGINSVVKAALAQGGNMAPWATEAALQAAIEGQLPSLQNNAYANQLLASGREAGAAMEDYAAQQAGLTKEMLDFYERRAAFQERIAGAQEDRANERWNLYKSLYLPVETAFVKEAAGGLIPQEEAERAAAAVRQSFSKDAEMYGRQLERLGVDPTSPRYVENLRSFDLARSAAEAAARNQARRSAVDTNFARKQVVVGLGKGIPSEAASIAASAGPFLTGGPEMLGNAANNLGNAAQTMGLAQQLQIQSASPLLASNESALNRAFKKELLQMKLDSEPSFSAGIRGALGGLLNFGFGA